MKSSIQIVVDNVVITLGESCSSHSVYGSMKLISSLISERERFSVSSALVFLSSSTKILEDSPLEVIHISPSNLLRV